MKGGKCQLGELSKTMRKTNFIILIAIAFWTATPKIHAAQQPYFSGKTIMLQVGAPAGGRQDRIARTLAKYLTKYTPGNPAFLIQNKTGGPESARRTVLMSNGLLHVGDMSFRRTGPRAGTSPY